MTELIAAALADPAIRAEIEKIALEAVALLLHRRATDPDFLEKSDAVNASLAGAKTPEDLTNAQKALQSLMATG